MINRKVLPLAIDWPVFGLNTVVKPLNKYFGSNVKRHLTTSISDNTVIGCDTSVGARSVIINSTIGNNCKIGEECWIVDCIIWDNVDIRKGSKL